MRRSAGPSLGLSLARRAGLLLLLFAVASPAVSRADGPLTYAYDELGRLVAVVDTFITSGTNAAVYQYDAVGNLTAITNNSATRVAIFAFAPSNDTVGSTIIIYGDGFSTTPSQNTVTFYNGKNATPTASTLATLTVAVPAGATTGPVKVTSPNGSATSAESFTVD